MSKYSIQVQNPNGASTLSEHEYCNATVVAPPLVQIACDNGLSLWGLSFAWIDGVN